MRTLRSRPELIKDVNLHYCPGCGHGIIHRILAECLDEFGLRDKSVGIAPVGCSVFMYNYIDIDYVEVAHGRAPAVATGVKKSLPDHFVLTYQGDGDMASIGMAEIVHAAHRGLPLTFIFVNNAIYGMTGGQMAPTTLIGQKSTTSQDGRNPANDGFPIRMCELLTPVEGVAYLERTKVNTPQDIIQTKKAIQKAFRAQIDRKGFAMVEILAMCPVNWHLDPIASLDFVDTMAEVYPIKVFKDLPA